MDDVDFGLEDQDFTTKETSTYTPQVKDDIKPKIGMEFASLDDVQSFYNSYARETGFSIRSHSTKKSRDTEEVIRKEFVCYKQGVPKKKIDSIRRRGTVREGCEAKISVLKSKQGPKYIISQFVEGHNHPLATPRKRHLLKSHRRMSGVVRSLTEHLGAVDVSTRQQMDILGMQAGGIENVGCTERDLYNAERDDKKIKAGHDANMLYEHFKSEQEKNPAFTFAIEADEDNSITHCFWADATCKRAYQFFGDVVVFDTTYNTNRYGMIFAPFVGVNNHGQTTQFGCAFLPNEKTETFVWLFEQWLKAMPAGPPKMIITDQDHAITSAIGQVLKNTFHRYCSWHIINKFSERIGAIKYQEYYIEFKTCIWDSQSPKEFETRWANIVEKSQLHDNNWLNEQYALREKWIPAYVNDKFSANMSSSQRAEISHAFLKRFVHKRNSFLDFVVRFKRALAHQRAEELRLDHKDINENPVSKTNWPMERQMIGIYTHNIFYKFQEQLWICMGYILTVVSEDEDQCVYNVQLADGGGFRVRELVEDKSLDLVSCSCKKFEAEGIPCRHMLIYFIRKHIVYLPDMYILRRWTKMAKTSIVYDDTGEHVKDVYDSSLITRRSHLFRLASDVIDSAMVSEEASEVVRQHIELAAEKIKLMSIGKDGGGSTQIVTSCELIYKEPNPVRAKGCGKRLKGGKEKAKVKKRRCHGCGLTGQEHDKRNCPKLNSISSKYENVQDVDDGDEEDEEEADV